MTTQNKQTQGATQGSANNDSAWTGFLVAAFVAVGLWGGMATYAAQVPFEHALARNAALDRVLAAASAPDAAAQLERLRPELGDSADRVLTGPGDIASRVAAERPRMLAAFGAEARRTGEHLRLVLAVFTATGAFFGAAILGIVRRSKPN
jgi:hypothetical protein